jgi:dTDP-4-amino-4,6-dideoxygalactose transaminase
LTQLIGGMFGLQAIPDSNASRLPFVTNRTIYLVNVRSGIWLLAQQLAPGQIWCPSYLCLAVLNAVRGHATRVRFYEVDYDLTLPSLQWLDQVRPGDLVLVIDYFGFRCDSECAVRAKERGAWVVEDASQALLSGHIGQYTDFVLFSPRKFVGVPDGGLLCLNGDVHFRDIELETSPTEWWLKAFSASVLRREFDSHGGTRSWFELFQDTEPSSPIGRFAMSELSRTLLQNSFDYVQIAHKRMDNYRILADRLGSLAVFPSLSDQTVPIGFPIHVSQRDKVRQTLFAHEIYPPVHWVIQGAVPDEYRASHRLASEIMTLPCDQRYDEDDMNRMAQLVAEAAGC